jgi:hypothetical protein
MSSHIARRNIDVWFLTLVTLTIDFPDVVGVPLCLLPICRRPVPTSVALFIAFLDVIGLSPCPLTLSRRRPLYDSHSS